MNTQDPNLAEVLERYIDVRFYNGLLPAEDDVALPGHRSFAPETNDRLVENYRASFLFGAKALKHKPCSGAKLPINMGWCLAVAP